MASPVAPLVGAWIEISADESISVRAGRVAPLVGAWIEISFYELEYVET